MRTQPVFGSETRSSGDRFEEYADSYYLPRVVRESPAVGAESPAVVESPVESRGLTAKDALPVQWYEYLYSGRPSGGSTYTLSGVAYDRPKKPKQPPMDMKETMDIMNNMSMQTSPMGGMMGMAIDPMQMILGVGFFCLVALGCAGVVMHNRRSQASSRMFIQRRRRRSSCSTCDSTY